MVARDHKVPFFPRKVHRFRCESATPGVIQCYLTYKNVMLDRQDLCLVMEEQFDGTEDDVFGPNGYFMREVDASGSGYVCSFSAI